MAADLATIEGNLGGDLLLAFILYAGAGLTLTAALAVLASDDLQGVLPAWGRDVIEAQRSRCGRGEPLLGGSGGEGRSARSLSSRLIRAASDALGRRVRLADLRGLRVVLIQRGRQKFGTEQAAAVRLAARWKQIDAPPWAVTKACAPRPAARDLSQSVAEELRAHVDALNNSRSQNRRQAAEIEVLRDEIKSLRAAVSGPTNGIQVAFQRLAKVEETVLRLATAPRAAAAPSLEPEKWRQMQQSLVGIGALAKRLDDLETARSKSEAEHRRTESDVRGLRFDMSSTVEPSLLRLKKTQDDLETDVSNALLSMTVAIATLARGRGPDRGAADLLAGPEDLRAEGEDDTAPEDDEEEAEA